MHLTSGTCSPNQPDILNIFNPWLEYAHKIESLEIPGYSLEKHALVWSQMIWIGV